MSLVGYLANAYSPYPRVDPDGGIAHGLSMDVPKICRKCATKECGKLHGERLVDDVARHVTCPYGVSVFACPVQDETVILIGLLDQSKNKVPSKLLRNQLSKNKVAPYEVENWRLRMVETHSLVIKEIDKRFANTSAILHDVKSSANLVATNTLAFIDTLPGSSFEEKCDRAPDAIRRIFASSEFLVQQARFMDILSNPQALYFGRKHGTRFVDLAFKMFKAYQNEAQMKNKTLTKEFNSTFSIAAYESIAFVPLVLLDNATKYGMAGTTIRVECRDIGAGGIYFSVTSEGPILPMQDRPRIFEKYFRSSINSSQTAGNGLGLYTAQMIAKAHGTVIYYGATPLRVIAGQEIGNNKFYLTFQNGYNPDATVARRISVRSLPKQA
jgi:hypothetical protein